MIFTYAKTKYVNQLISNSKADHTYVITSQKIQSIFFLSPKFQAFSFFCDCTDQFVPDLVQNRQYRLYYDKAHLIGTHFNLLLFCAAAIFDRKSFIACWNWSAGDTAGVGVRTFGVGCLTTTGGGTVYLLASDGGGATRTRLEGSGKK